MDITWQFPWKMNSTAKEEKESYKEKENPEEDEHTAENSSNPRIHYTNPPIAILSLFVYAIDIKK